MERHAGSPTTVPPIPTAPYTRREVVYRPTDPKKFNGTVIVEWLNVSGPVDANPDWTLTHNELIRDGFAWVGVSAQAVGVNHSSAPAGRFLPVCPAPGDPVRYGSLSHPGDSYSYDIFSQAGQAIRDNSALILGGRPEKLIAAGESQSAGRMVTYIDAVQPRDDVTTGSSCTAGAPRVPRCRNRRKPGSASSSDPPDPKTRHRRR